MNDFESRSFDGSNNNLNFRDWGKANTQLRRGVLPAYGDGVSSLARRGRENPDPRTVSNEINAQDGPVPSAKGLSDLVWAWGQYLDHEIDLTESDKREPANIVVEKGDHALPGGGSVPINRSLFDLSTGTGPDNPRQQINQISTYIDASNVYGSDECRAHVLRTLEDGKLKSSDGPDGGLLPLNTMGLPNATFGPIPEDEYFVAGDIRTNENSMLISMHTLFMREHNRVCDDIKSHPQKYGLSGELKDETIYQMARKVVGGIQQAITYNEFLPTLLGTKTCISLDDYQGYQSNVESSIDNTFSTACYRVGHTMVSENLFLKGECPPELPLADAFFKPEQVKNYGIAPFFAGAASRVMQEIDVQVVDALRNLLFTPPDQGDGVMHDLVSLNIQRGRDHGLPDYNTCRQGYGLEPIYEFSDITTNREVARNLQRAYGDVDSIDPWVGGLAEDHVDGANVGLFVGTVLKQQYERLRDGDRFWYESDPALPEAVKGEIACTTFSQVIMRNTNICDLQDNVFIAQP